MIDTATRNSWINIFRPNAQARLRLFCFPYAGGSSYEFRSWAHKLPQEMELCVIQLPGREGRIREMPYTQLNKLVETLGNAIVPYLDKSFVFFGHSLGAFISFELVRQLRRQNNFLPVHLFVSGSRAPHIPNPEPPVYQLPDSELVEEICRRYDGIPKEILENAELMELILPAMRADFTMSDTYQFADEPPFDFPITCFGGEDDRCTTDASLDAWRSQTKARFTLKVFAGGHFFIRHERDAILDILSGQVKPAVKGSD